MRSPYRLFVPVFLAVSGVVFLLDEAGMPGLGWIAAIFWPALLLGFGVEAWGQQRRIWGAVLGLAGGLLWLNNFDYLHWHLEQFWPLALVAAGVCLVIRQEN